jgi:hypothetical protein
MITKSASISEIVSYVFNKNQDMEAKFSRPAPEQDRFFTAEYDHPKSEETCLRSEVSQQINRAPRNSDEPEIHYGLIAPATR